MEEYKNTAFVGVYRQTAIIKAVLKVMRPHHWVKNIFMFIPLFFAGEFFNLLKIGSVAAGFMAFSLVASSIYVINDYRDADTDRLHPKKASRPIASGEISKTLAIWLFLGLFLAGFGISLLLEPKFIFILSLYFIINLAYSFGLKNISILDVFLVSVGFLLRIRAGGTLGDVHVSEWLSLMVFLLALFMAFGKRRDDLILQKNSSQSLRKSVKEYNLDFLTAAMTLITSISLVAYLMYTVSPEVKLQFGTYRLYHTFWFVLAGLLRYFQIIYVVNDSGSPTKILYKDYFLHACILLWALSFFLIIYFPEIKIFK